MAYNTKHLLGIIKVSILLLVINYLVGHINAVENPTTEEQSPSHVNHTQGRWELLMENVGVVAMHMAVTHRDTVVIFDQTGAGPSRYRLRRRFGGRGRPCSADSTDGDCFAHSVEYDVAGNGLRALRLESDPWCSAGAFLGNGTLLQAGGNGAGARRVRYFRPCRWGGACEWRQAEGRLAAERWYASAVALPEREDRVMVVGGRRVFSYEFVPKRSHNERAFNLPLLRSTYERDSSGNNLYPFLHLSSDGNLFIFANRDSILFNYRRNRVVRTFPRIPGRGSRSYPSTGSSVILPLDHANDFRRVEVMICGGAASGAYRAARRGRSFTAALSTCGRMVIANTTAAPRWRMERMPRPRVMGDMVILPTGEVLIVNGAERGAAGWENARNASRRPYLYSPSKARGKRFSVLSETSVPRMYHSSAVLLRDGRVLVGGSNPHNRYRFHNVRYPTEMRLQAFVPHYMDPHYHQYRPTNLTVHPTNNTNASGDGSVRYGEDFSVRFWLGRRPSEEVEYAAYAPPFTTHSMSMNQRMLRLRAKATRRSDDGWVSAVLEAPPHANVAPAGYYMLTVVNGGIPSVSQWVRFTHHAN